MRWGALNDLIDSYANIEHPLSSIKDDERYELISEAIRKNKLGLFEQYLQSDRDSVISACNFQSSIPLLHIAAQNSNPVYLEKLFNLRVSPNQLDEDLNTPAFHCATNLYSILLLHKSGCNLNAKNKLGNTLLHILARSEASRVSLFHQYVELGCDPTVQNNKGISPLDLLEGPEWIQEILRIYHWYKAKTILFLKKHHASILERIPQGIVRQIIEYL